MAKVLKNGTKMRFLSRWVLFYKIFWLNLDQNFIDSLNFLKDINYDFDKNKHDYYNKKYSLAKSSLKIIRRGN